MRDDFIITTTPNVEGRVIVEYKGVVFGEVIAGINFLKDIGAAFRNVFGGRSKGYERELEYARSDALTELRDRARELGGNAVVGMKMDYEAMGSKNDMLMVTCSGTAVVTRPVEPES